MPVIPAPSTRFIERRVTDNLEQLKAALPTHLVNALEAAGPADDLLEVIIDLGRVPTARYVTGEVMLDEHEITHDDLKHVVSLIGTFDADNRAGIERTLHRISAIRNRRGDIVGLTCRIGRAVFGTLEIIEDLIYSGKNVLILGAPGVGKTTMLREAARVLAERKRVVIVDTSNEIGGDGDVPHPAVGRARRMQVAEPAMQHEVMIEAVENHNPEVIVIDEIGRELEAQAARTIAERGVQLIGTAHGQTLDNLMLNPTLSDLIGGIESVTLSDEEARRRGTQKTVLERRSPPTFDVLIELQDRYRMTVHQDISAAVDARLRGRSMPYEVRYRAPTGEVVIETITPTPTVQRSERGDRGDRMDRGMGGQSQMNGRLPFERQTGLSPARNAINNGLGVPIPPMSSMPSMPPPRLTERISDQPARSPVQAAVQMMVRNPAVPDDTPPRGTRQPIRVHPFGVARNRLQQAAKKLRMPLIIEDDVDNAQVVLTLKNYYRRRPKPIADAEERGVSIYVMRANTMTQMEDFIADLFQLPHKDDDPILTEEEELYADAIQDATEGIERILAGARMVDLSPQSAAARRVQHDLAREENLVSHSYGQEPHRHVRIFADRRARADFELDE